MNSFTISQLERYSGISVHSIRAWEKRYHALQPSRSAGNTRSYSGNQLKRLLNIASLRDSEFKISEICALPDAKLNALLYQQLEKNLPGREELLVSQMVASALTFDETLFNKVFSQAMLNHSMEDTYLNVIYPVVKRLGVLWQVDKTAPAQEHFISNLIRQKLNSSIDRLLLSNQAKHHWLLFLPENEFHETGLLMAHYLVKQAGHRCTYLGANVPFDSLRDAVKMVNPGYLLCFLVSKNDVKEDMTFIRLLLKSFPTQNIMVAAEPNRLSKIKVSGKFTGLPSVQELQTVLKSLSY